MYVIILAGAPSPEFEVSVCIGILIAVLIIWRFLRRPQRSGSRRHIGLALIGLIAGPILGLLLATIEVRYGNTDPLDQDLVYEVFFRLGMMAGVVGFLLIAVFAKARTPAKSDRVQDDGSNG